MGFDPKLKGVYNVGLDSANCTKMELAKQVAEIVNPKAIIQTGQGKDPDRRNYNVSSQRIMGTGFRANYTLADGIKQVKKLCEIYSKDQLDNMKNA
jgi:nucleoside-diphosphate-sugar epimerase